jgi:hypothetical protein
MKKDGTARHRRWMMGMREIQGMDERESNDEVDVT